MEENKSPATSCEMPALVNYRGKWRDDQFNGAGDPEHIPGNDSAIICSIIFALAKGPTQGGSSKVYQLSGARHAPLLDRNFWGWGCVNGQRKYQFHGQPPTEITSPCPNIFQTTQPRRIKWSRQQIAVERFSITSTRLWRNRRTSRCDIFFLFLISFLLYAVPETFLFLYPVSSNFSPLFFFPTALPQFISQCLFCSLNHSFLFRSTYLSSLPSFLLAVRGLSEKIGSFVPKADGQPNDPGVKGELSQWTFFFCQLKLNSFHSNMSRWKLVNWLPGPAARAHMCEISLPTRTWI